MIAINLLSQCFSFVGKMTFGKLGIKVRKKKRREIKEEEGEGEMGRGRKEKGREK